MRGTAHQTGLSDVSFLPFQWSFALFGKQAGDIYQHKRSVRLFVTKIAVIEQNHLLTFYLTFNLRGLKMYWYFEQDTRREIF